MTFEKERRAFHIAEIVVASCSGTDQLTSDLGRAVVHIDAVAGADAAIVQLDAKKHGCAVRWPRSFQAQLIEEGWDDWRIIPIDADPFNDPPVPFGIEVRRGWIAVPSPGDVTIEDFGMHLRQSLFRFRLQEFTIEAEFLEARCDAMADIVVHPRYTPPARRRLIIATPKS